MRARYSVGDGSDTGRIGRQQEFMSALAEKAKSKMTDPVALYKLLQSLTKSLTTDDELADAKSLTDLASELKGVPEDRLTFLTVPSYPREADVPTDKANVVWQYPQAATVFTALAKDEEIDKKSLEAGAKDPLYASSVHVRVLNGSGTEGKAAAVAERLREAGFTVTGTGNAPHPGRTAVTCPPGFADRAAVLASQVPGAHAVEDAGAPAGEVTLVVGAELDVDDLR